MSFYHFARQVCRIYLKIFFRIEYLNEENVPAKGAVICCCNHNSNLDPVMVGCIKQRDFSFMAKEELFEVPLFGRLIRSLHAFPVKRNSGDLGAIKKAMTFLQEGHALVLFPEGRRSKDGKLQEGKDGVSLLAKKTGATVIPCATNGKPKLFRKTKIIYGKPIDMEKYADTKDLKPLTKCVMEEIGKLMGEL